MTHVLHSFVKNNSQFLEIPIYLVHFREDSALFMLIAPI